MCLSEVYKQTDSEPEFLCKNIAKIIPMENEVVFYDFMGRKTVFYGSILSVDLMENTVLVKENRQ